MFPYLLAIYKNGEHTSLYWTTKVENGAGDWWTETSKSQVEEDIGLLIRKLNWIDLFHLRRM